MISQKYRFHGHASLRYVIANGQQSRGKNLSIKFVDNQRRRYPRAAVVVSKKVYKHAIDRNRIRRRLYEIIRQYINELDKPIDIVITVYRPEVLDMPHVELLQEVSKCLDKIG